MPSVSEADEGLHDRATSPSSALRAPSPRLRGEKEERLAVIVAAAQEVGPALFFSLLVITVSFLPIFALEAQEGRLFKPLAYTKNLTMAIAALLALTLDPALRMAFTRIEPFRFKPTWLAKIATMLLVGKYRSEIGRAHV